MSHFATSPYTLLAIPSCRMNLLVMVQAESHSLSVNLKVISRASLVMLVEMSLMETAISLSECESYAS